MRRRTPKNYSGTESPAKKVSELLPEIASEIAKKASIPDEAIFQYWNMLIGERVALMTEPVSFVDEVLTVKVKSSTLYSLLAVHEKAKLLASLQDKFSIRNIVFRVG